MKNIFTFLFFFLLLTIGKLFAQSNEFATGTKQPEKGLYVKGNEYIYNYHFSLKGQNHKYEVNNANYAASDFLTDAKSMLRMSTSEATIDKTLKYFSLKADKDARTNISGEVTMEQAFYDQNDEVIFTTKAKVLNNPGEVSISNIANPLKDAFGMLSYNPDPAIKAPMLKGNEWTKNKEVLKMLASSEKNSSLATPAYVKQHYKIKGSKKIKTSFGKLKCTKVVAEAESESGTTSAEFYFHEDYGFVKMIYHNLDASTLVVELTEIK